MSFLSEVKIPEMIEKVPSIKEILTQRYINELYFEGIKTDEKAISDNGLFNIA